MRTRVTLALIAIISLALTSARTKSSEHVKGGFVKITPLGSHPGEFCRNDRAILFEDPTGVRILWDPGRTVDENDVRLGAVHLVVLSSVHGDHIGDARPNTNSPGICAAPGTVSAAPSSTSAAIAAKQNAALFAGGEMASFLGKKIADINKVATTAGCPDSDPNNPMAVPLAAPCTGSLRPGGTRAVKIAGAAGETSGVKIRTFQAFHSNGIPASLLDAPGVAPGTTGYGGNDGGAVFEFTNDLKVYCTGDTGPTVDMKFVVKDMYGVDLVVANIGDIQTMGPDVGAYVVNEWLQPTTVIPSHINQEATSGGVPTGYRLLQFLSRVDRRTDVVIPLSGVTRLFDGRGRCVNCGGK